MLDFLKQVIHLRSSIIRWVAIVLTVVLSLGFIIPPFLSEVRIAAACVLLVILVGMIIQIADNVSLLVSEIRFEGFEHCRDALFDEIEHSIRKKKITRDPHTRVRVVAVAMRYSSNFICDKIPELLQQYPTAKLRLHLCIAAPDFLRKKGLEDWAAYADTTIEAIAQLQKRHKELFESGKLKLELHKYHNLSQWHGLLIDKDTLFLGRTHWVMKGEDENRDAFLNVGQEVYRMFRWSDTRGGKERIERFYSWYKYYKDYAIQKEEGGELRMKLKVKEQ